MNIKENIIRLKASLPEKVTLVAVSKYHPAEALREAYDAGQRVFGESRAQELTAKQKVLPTDIEWHFIGSLQSNKVKDIVPFISLIHSIDSLKLLREVDKYAGRCNRTIRVLLEIRIAQEETKHGMTPQACREMLEEWPAGCFPHIRICGLMGMATDTDDETQIRREFHGLQALFTELKSSYFRNSPDFTELSMGMSHDYPLALEEGSTMVRIGTAVFGERSY